MATKPISDELLQQAVNAEIQHGEQSAAARSLGINRNTFVSRIEKARERGIRPTVEPKQTAAGLRKEARDVEYWRKRAVELGKELQTVEHMLEEVSGLVHMDCTPPTWLQPSKHKTRKRSVICAMLSDVHAGEVVEADEILGLNAYDIEICRKRLRRFFSAICNIGTRWGQDTSNQGAVLFLTGDLISGDIHEELRTTNELTAHEQVRFMVEEVTAGIAMLKNTFGHVHVSSVPGNHGRTTPKPTFKLYSRLNYDTLAASMVADRFKDDPKVTFQIGSARDQIVPVLGFPIFQSHGDGLGAGGGQGFIGPMAPIVRGVKKVEAQQARAGRTPYWTIHGHFHTSGQPGNSFANGSVPGYTEYANGFRASIEPPQQWMWMMHEAWGVRDRLEVKLEDISPAGIAAKKIPAFLTIGDAA